MAKQAKKSSNTLKIQQIRSAITRPQDQTATLIGLGLNKINKVRELEDTPAVRGMVRKVSHLVKVIEN
ncbi:MAG: 50S ribosomal protein L30 [Alphaproteobacteria bacterium]|jgi:large subunit ribosomal protein L30|nr:50S ribosomal protein L30 [Alphaproteobacteria bacterium]